MEGIIIKERGGVLYCTSVWQMKYRYVDLLVIKVVKECFSRRKYDTLT